MIPFDDLHLMVIHGKFGTNQTYGFRGDVKNVFLKRFNMAENLVRWTLRVPEAFIERIQLNMCVEF